MDYLVTYDIETVTPAGRKRLSQVAKICEAYGRRVQFSVFECRLSDTMLARLRASILATIRPGTDSVNIYALQGSAADSRESLGRPLQSELGDAWIV